MTKMSRKYPQLYDPVLFQQLEAECRSNTAIAEKIGCSIRSVVHARSVLGLNRGFGAPRRFPQLYDPVALRALQAECGTDEAIANKLNCSVQSVRIAREAMGIPRASQTRFAILYDRDAFLALHPYERPATEIAAEIGCSPVSVRAARRRFGLKREWDDRTPPMLRYPDVLAYLMERYKQNIISVADAAGADPQSVRSAIVRFREAGYHI